VKKRYSELKELSNYTQFRS